MAEYTREEVERIVKKAPGGRSELPRLNERDLSRLDLSNLDFNFANLSGTNLSETNLSGANLTGVDCIAANLSRAILCEAKLTGAILSGTHLIEANLSNADLTTANLLGAILIEANFYSADLYKADLSLSALARVNFTEANLSWTDFTGAVLEEIDFSKAKMWGTILGDIDLREIRGLDTVKHSGPSSIDTRTLIHSKGEIPEMFLRGCGFSDLQLEMAKLYYPNLTSKEVSSITNKIREFFPVQYYSCFISYSSQNEAFAQRLHADLQQKGVRCWFAPKDMKIGDKIRSTIDQSIRIHDKLLIILSENSLSSEWVESEVEKAFEEEHKRKQTVLFPIRLDDAVMETEESWAADIRRTRHIGDFSRWKDHDAYQLAFERLLRDLKASTE